MSERIIHAAYHQQVVEAKDATIKTLREALAHFGECYVGTDLDNARLEIATLHKRVEELTQLLRRWHQYESNEIALTQGEELDLLLGTEYALYDAGGSNELP